MKFAMYGSGSPLKKYLFPTLALIAGMGWLYWNYVNRKTEELETRNLRFLSVITETLTTRLDSVRDNVRDAIADESKHAMADGPLSRWDMDKFQSRVEGEIEKRLQSIDGIIWDESKVSFSNVPSDKGIIRSKMKIMPREDTLELSWDQVYKLDSGGKGRWSRKRKAVFQLMLSKDAVFQQLAYSDQFEVLLVLQQAEGEKGRLLFQSSRSDQRGIRLRELRKGDGQFWVSDKEAILQATMPVSLGQRSYQLFSKRISLNESADPLEGEFLAVVGLIDRTAYVSEGRSFSSSLGMAVLIGLMLCFSILPLIRLGYMSKTDNLDPVKVSAIFLSPFMILFLAVLAGVGLFAHFFLDTRAAHELTATGMHIKNNFAAELALALQQLDDAELRSINGESHPSRTGGETTRDSIKIQRASEAPMDETAIDRKQTHPWFDSISWTDDGGKEEMRWGKAEDTTTLECLGQYEYFKELVSEEAPRLKWKGSNGEVRTEPCSLEFLPYAGQPKMVIARKRLLSGPENKSDEFSGIVALKSTLYSLEQPLLPNGMGFALIDENGMVLLHSDPKRNGRENLFTECREQPDLKDHIWVGNTASLDVDYMGKPHHFFVTPLHDDTPYTLALFRDKDDLQSFEMLTMSLMAITFVGYLLLLFLTAWLCSALFRRDSFNRRNMWLWPRKQNTGLYLELSMVFLALTMLNAATLFSDVIDLDTALINLGITGLLAILFVFLKLGFAARSCARRKWPLFKVLAALSATLLIAFIMLDMRMGMTFPAWMAVGIAPLLAALTFPLCRIIENAAYTVPGTAKTLLDRLHYVLVRWLKKKKIAVERLSYIKAYAFMFLMLSLAVILTPVLSLGRIAFLVGNGMETRESQLLLLEALDQRDDSLQEKTAFSRALGLYPESYYVDLVKESDQPIPVGTKGESLSDSRVMRLAPMLNKLTAENASSHRYLFDKAENIMNFHWHQTENHLILSELEPNKRDNYYQVITCDLPIFGMFRSWLDKPFFEVMALLFFIANLLGFLLLMHLFESILIKLYLLDLVPVDFWNTRDLKNMMSEHFVAGSFGIHYLVLGSSLPETFRGPPGTRVIDFNRQKNMDMRSWPLETAGFFFDKKLTVVLSNFDYIPAGLYGQRAMIAEQKFRLVELLLRKSQCRLIIFSAYNPVRYFDCLENSDREIACVFQEKTEQNPTSSMPSSRSWNILLSGFNEIAYLDESARIEATKTTFNVSKAVMIECQAWPFLTKMIPREQNQGWKNMSPEQLYNRLKTMFGNHYQYIWARCTKSERWTLYDLARDGFTNPSNKETLRHLIKKKLVIHDRWFRPAAESFRLFILEEFKRSDRPVNHWDQVNWGLLRIPLAIILLTGSAFIFLTQQELMQLFTSLGSTIILGLAPLILGSLGLTGKN